MIIYIHVHELMRPGIGPNVSCAMDDYCFHTSTSTCGSCVYLVAKGVDFIMKVNVCVHIEREDYINIRYNTI